MATILGLYQAASVALGETPITSTGEDRALRYSLDGVYADVLALCLEEGQWNFAEVTSKINYDNTFTWVFGFRYRFIKPADFVNLTGISLGEYVDADPLTNFKDVPGFWMCDSTPIYVRYTSSTVAADLTKWSASYTRYVAMSLALRLAGTIGLSTDKYDLLMKEWRYAKRDALSKDARLDGSKRPPPGRWVRARQSRMTGYRLERA
jgi:hypothetical protein